MKYIAMLMSNCAAVEKHVSTAEFRLKKTPKKKVSPS
jgi:hypothetical protein